jgi:putative transcriptional regulator
VLGLWQGTLSAFRLNLGTLPTGKIDFIRLDATTEQDITAEQHIDEANAILDAAKFARQVRKRLGLSQAEFSHRIDVSLDTIRNWEQGKRSTNRCG